MSGRVRRSGGAEGQRNRDFGARVLLTQRHRGTEAQRTERELLIRKARANCGYKVFIIHTS